MDARSKWPGRPIGGLSFLASQFMEANNINWREFADYGSPQGDGDTVPQTPVESGEELPEIEFEVTPPKVKNKKGRRACQSQRQRR